MPKRHVAAGTNSLSTNNEKRKTYAQRNLLKREQSKTEHNSPKRYIEVATNSLHRIQATYISINRGSLHPPRRSGHPGWMRWSPEDGEGGLRRVLLPRPLVRRKATMKSTRAMWYSSWKKPKETTKEQRRFLINTNPISQPQFPYRQTASRKEKSGARGRVPHRAKPMAKQRAP